MRGLTMILVVYSHIAVLMLNNTPHLLSAVNEVFLLFRMPLFFFISGYLAYSTTYNWDVFKRRSLNRLVKQFYPTLFLWFIFCSLFREDYLDNWILDTFKSGYWFTFVSVEMFFTVIPFLWLMSIYKASTRTTTIVLFLLCVVIEFIYFRSMRWGLNSDFFNTMSLWQYFQYIPFFILGMIAKIQRQHLHYLCSNVFCVLGVIILFILSVRYPQYPLFGIMSAISGIIIIYSIFYFFENHKRPSVEKAFKLMSIIGTSTLEIYLLHYFFIYTIRDTINVNFLASVSGTAIEFPIYFIVSVSICALCLLAVVIFKKLRIYDIMFPTPSINKMKRIIAK